MTEPLLAFNVLIAIALILFAIGAQKMHKAHAIEIAALRRELGVLEQSNADVVSTSFTSIDIAPGDILMLTTERHLTPEQHAAIRAQVEKMLPGVRAVVMAGGLRAVGLLAPVTRT